jgi:hypothetical protein
VLQELLRVVLDYTQRIDPYAAYRQTCGECESISERLRDTFVIGRKGSRGGKPHLSLVAKQQTVRSTPDVAKGGIVWRSIDLRDTSEGDIDKANIGDHGKGPRSTTIFGGASLFINASVLFKEVYRGDKSGSTCLDSERSFMQVGVGFRFKARRASTVCRRTVLEPATDEIDVNAIVDNSAMKGVGAYEL